MRKLMLLILLAALTLTVSAQDAEPTPFMRAMALVPDAGFVRDAELMVSYADYHAAIQARGLEIPESWAAFEALDDLRLLFTLPSAGPGNLLQYLRVGGPEYQALLGFEFFDIAQAVEVGVAPEMGQILIGDFTPEAVSAAYTARDYTIEQEDETGTLLCPAAGCDSGTRLDMANRNPANPFGGAIGRSEVMFAGNGVLLNSPILPVVQTLNGVYDGRTPSFADVPTVQTVGAALADYPFVNAVMLVNPLSLALGDPAGLLGSRTTQEAIDALLADMEVEVLPPYSMAAFAAAADETSEYGLAMLTYADAESAETAAAIIDARLASLNSMRVNLSYAEVYGVVGTLEAAQVTTDEATGLSLVTVRIVGAMPPFRDETGLAMRPDMPYNRLQEGLFSRDLLWLAWGAFPE